MLDDDVQLTLYFRVRTLEMKKKVINYPKDTTHHTERTGEIFFTELDHLM
jgi:hypothetical protein